MQCPSSVGWEKPRYPALMRSHALLSCSIHGAHCFSCRDGEYSCRREEKPGWMGDVKFEGRDASDTA
eukprot:229508-Pyramimonas_sp.AAC.1